MQGLQEGQVYLDEGTGDCFSHQCLAEDNFSSLMALANHLGLRLYTMKGHISPPGPVCIALGLEYNMDKNTISLSEEKVHALTSLLQDCLDKPKASKKELVSLIGKLLNMCNVLFDGRLFLNRIMATKRRANRFYLPGRSFR